MGNPHAVAFVDDDATMAGPTCTEPPEHDAAAYPDGVNVEFVVRRGEQHVAMRVHERGSGETRSCGTGAVRRAWWRRRGDGRRDGRAPARRTRVDVPGGILQLTWTADDRLLLTGPAVLVAEGTDVEPLTAVLGSGPWTSGSQLPSSPERRRASAPPCARQLAAQGARVVVADLNAEKGEALARARSAACSSPVDVTNTDQIKAAVEQADELGPLRVLVNSAGIGWAQRTVGRDGDVRLRRRPRRLQARSSRST